MSNIIAFLVGWGIGMFTMAFMFQSLLFVALGIVMWSAAFVLDKRTV